MLYFVSRPIFECYIGCIAQAKAVLYLVYKMFDLKQFIAAKQIRNSPKYVVLKSSEVTPMGGMCGPCCATYSSFARFGKLSLPWFIQSRVNIKHEHLRISSYRACFHFDPPTQSFCYSYKMPTRLQPSVSCL